MTPADASARRVVGLDGFPQGWVAVHLVDGAVAEVEVVGRAAEALGGGAGEALGGGAVAAGLDIPIGLVDAPARAADRAARALLGPRASSVFNAPPRAVVDAWRAGHLADHAAATALAVSTTGAGISQQAWRLVPKIAEVDALRHQVPVQLLEVHPEVAFALVAGGPLPRKRSWAGLQVRQRVLERLGIRLPHRFPGDDRVAPDDVIDAAVCAWVADAVPQGVRLLTVPDEAVEHDGARPVLIHARPPVPPARGTPRR